MAAPTEKEITELLTAIDQTTLAIAYAGTVVMEVDPTPVEGTRYRYILSNADDPREREGR